MNAPPPPPGSRLGTGWKIAIACAAALTISAIIIFAATFYYSRAADRRAQTEIQKRLDAIRAAGEPVTAEDLAKLYPDPPPDQDAKILLAPALTALQKPAGGEVMGQEVAFYERAQKKGQICCSQFCLVQVSYCSDFALA